MFPTNGVRQGYILFPILFNFLLESIMTDALDGINSDRIILNNLRFADNIDLIVSYPDQLKHKTGNTVNRYGMNISSKRSKILVTGLTLSK